MNTLVCQHQVDYRTVLRLMTQDCMKYGAVTIYIQYDRVTEW